MASIKDFIKNIVSSNKKNNDNEKIINSNITINNLEKTFPDSLKETTDKPDDSSPNFIKKSDDFGKENNNETKDIKSQLNQTDSQKLDDIIDIFRKTQIRPLANQQRNLDREEGGVEHETKETEAHIIDNWDNRGEEIINMSDSHPINKSSAKKSMLWNLKRKKIQEKEIDKELAGIAGDLKKLKMQNSQEGSEFDSRKQQNMTQRIQALKEDRTDFKPPSNIR